MSDSSTPFRIWIRRVAGAAEPYAVRFEVFDGKGVLRVARPGILIDPPARVSGFEDNLSADQVRASRFLHVWAGGRKRQSHILSRLDDAVLSDMEPDTWIEFDVHSDAGYRYLVLGGVVLPPAPAAPPPPPTAQFDDEEVTEIKDGELPPGIRAPVKAPPSAPPSLWGRFSAGDAQHDNPTQVDIRRPLATPPRTATLPPPGTAAPRAVQSPPPPTPVSTPAAPAPASPRAPEPAPTPAHWGVALTYERGGTALVRILRRELQAKDLRIAELEARLRILEKVPLPPAQAGPFGFGDDDDEPAMTVLKRPPEGFDR